MIVEPTILFNLFMALVCVWVAMTINSKFLRPAILNKKRFAIYELRDQLALLAMRGVIDEKSEEFVTLLRIMNMTIASTKDFRITRYVKLQSEIIADKQLRAHLESILLKIKSEKMPNEYRVIVSGFFEVALDIYKHKIWMLSNLLAPLIALVTLLAHVIKTARKLKGFLVSQRDKINHIESELRENKIHFAILSN
jgi:hypothetical protein